MKPTLSPLLQQRGFYLDCYGDLCHSSNYVCADGCNAKLDGSFDLEELEAIVEWMRAQPEER